MSGKGSAGSVGRPIARDSLSRQYTVIQAAWIRAHVAFRQQSSTDKARGDTNR
jgi:hypothetical protein